MVGVYNEAVKIELTTDKPANQQMN